VIIQNPIPNPQNVQAGDGIDDDLDCNGPADIDANQQAPQDEEDDDDVL